MMRCAMCGGNIPSATSCSKVARASIHAAMACPAAFSLILSSLGSSTAPRLVRNVRIGNNPGGKAALSAGAPRALPTPASSAGSLDVSSQTGRAAFARPAAFCLG